MNLNEYNEITLKKFQKYQSELAYQQGYALLMLKAFLTKIF